MLSLLLFVLCSSLLTNEVPIHAGGWIALMLNSNLAEQQQRVLHLGVLLLPVLPAEVVEPLDLVQNDIDNRDEDRHANRVAPNENHRDKVSPAVGGVDEHILRDRAHDTSTTAGKPAEDGEDSGQNVNDKDSSYELPRGPSLAATGNEDEPVLGERNLEEENLLDRAVVLDDTTVGQEHCAADDPGTKGKKSTENNTHYPNLAQLPFDGTGLDVGVVVRDGDGSQISEQGDEDDEIGANRLVQDDH